MIDYQTLEIFSGLNGQNKLILWQFIAWINEREMDGIVKQA